jgi:hypothetical protein
MACKQAAVLGECRWAISSYRMREMWGNSMGCYKMRSNAEIGDSPQTTTRTGTRWYPRLFINTRYGLPSTGPADLTITRLPHAPEPDDHNNHVEAENRLDVEYKPPRTGMRNIRTITSLRYS